MAMKSTKMNYHSSMNTFLTILVILITKCIVDLILAREINTYHLSVLESLFIRTFEPKIFTQRDVFNLKL